MPTSDIRHARDPGATPDESRPTVAGLRLDEGPLGEAMAAVDRAVDDIARAEDTLVARRRDLVAVLADELAAVIEDEHDDVIAQVRPTLAALYWEHDDVIRVQDLTGATGLTGAQLRRVVGPRVLERSCDGCSRPVEVVHRSRSDRGRRPLCAACRVPPPPADPWHRLDDGRLGFP